MNTTEIYKNIANRGGGDLYIGVVGPVRTGKSTFIAKFMETLVVPNITNNSEKQRVIDDIPQSGSGTTVMTTQPKFIPARSCCVNLAENVQANVRLVDCVGYMVDGADSGEGGLLAERMVKTPWSQEEIPFSKAAEIGTEKVIKDHSTVGIVLSTDGTICDIPRPNYALAEERCVNELKALKKPFVVVLNSKTPNAEETRRLVESLNQKYQVPVLAMDGASITEKEIAKIFTQILNEYTFEKIEIKLPSWLALLPRDNPYIEEIISEGKAVASKIAKMGDATNAVMFEESSHFEKVNGGTVMLDKGIISYEIKPNQNLFYDVLSSQAGMEIKNEFDLVSILKEMATAKQSYDKIKEAMESLEETGYGIVKPSPEQMTLGEPEIIKQGNRYGVKLKASAPSLHIMKVDIETEVNPILGTEAQSEELVKNMMQQFENNPQELWQTNIFGKSLFELVNDGLKSKLQTMPGSAQIKMRKTLGRIVNEGKGGVICILL